MTESTPVNEAEAQIKPNTSVYKGKCKQESQSSETSEEKEEEESIMKKRVEALILKLHPPEVDLI